MELVDVTSAGKMNYFGDPCGQFLIKQQKISQPLKLKREVHLIELKSNASKLIDL